MLKKIIYILIVVIVVLLGIKYLPFGVSSYELPSHIKLNIPKLSFFDTEAYMYEVSFNSFRSHYILEKELSDTLKKYEEITCDGFHYYFDKEENITIMGYQIKNNLFFHHISIMYRLGNYCEEKAPELETDKYYSSLEELPRDYSLEDAMKDNNFIITAAKVYNEQLYIEFMEKYEKKDPAFLRIIETTIEGDLIIKDITYDTKKVIVVTDDTRDSYASNGSIKKEEYEKVGVKKIENQEAFVAYNQELNEDNDCVLAIIN